MIKLEKLTGAYQFGDYKRHMDFLTSTFGTINPKNESQIFMENCKLDQMVKTIRDGMMVDYQLIGNKLFEQMAVSFMKSLNDLSHVIMDESLTGITRPKDDLIRETFYDLLVNSDGMLGWISASISFIHAVMAEFERIEDMFDYEFDQRVTEAANMAIRMLESNGEVEGINSMGESLSGEGQGEINTEELSETVQLDCDLLDEGATPILRAVIELELDDSPDQVMVVGFDADDMVKELNDAGYLQECLDQEELSEIANMILNWMDDNVQMNFRSAVDADYDECSYIEDDDDDDLIDLPSFVHNNINGQDLSGDHNYSNEYDSQEHWLEVDDFVQPQWQERQINATNGKERKRWTTLTDDFEFVNGHWKYEGIDY